MIDAARGPRMVWDNVRYRYCMFEDSPSSRTWGCLSSTEGGEELFSTYLDKRAIIMESKQLLKMKDSH